MTLLGGAAATSSALAHGQQNRKPWRIGIPADIPPSAATTRRFGAFRDGLKELGYAEGSNIVIDYRDVDGSRDGVIALCKDMIASGDDVIVAGSTKCISIDFALWTSPRICTSIRARLGVPHPILLGKPFMLGPTNRAVDPCEKDRHGLEALAIRSQTGGDVPSGLRASHHDGPHWPLLAFVVAATRYAPPVKIV